MLQSYNLILFAILIIFPFFLLKKDKEHFFLRILFIYHIIFFIINFYYKGYFSSDANGYFLWAQDPNYNKNILSGTTIIVFIIKFLQNFLKFDEMNIHLLFSLFGYLGIFVAYKVINEKNNHEINKIIFLFPSLHFFTSSVGKDSLIMLVIGFLILFFDRKKIILYLIMTVLFFFTRPHASIMFGSLMIVLLFAKYYDRFIYYLKNFLLLKILFFLSIILICYTIFIFKLELLHILEVTIKTALNRQNYFYLAKSGYPVEYLSVIEMLFYYLFAPLGLVFNKSFFYTFVGIENLILLSYFLISLIFCKLKNIKIFSKDFFLILFIFTYLMLISFVNTNLGISTRQKWMILPFIFYIFSIYCNYPKLGIKIKGII